MAIRIEIAKMWNEKLEMREGDLTGSTTSSNVTKEDILKEIGDLIDELPKFACCTKSDEVKG